jgi:hypothetical protein
VATWPVRVRLVGRWRAQAALAGALCLLVPGALSAAALPLGPGHTLAPPSAAPGAPVVVGVSPRRPGAGQAVVVTLSEPPSARPKAVALVWTGLGRSATGSAWLRLVRGPRVGGRRLWLALATVPARTHVPLALRARVEVALGVSSLSAPLAIARPAAPALPEAPAAALFPAALVAALAFLRLRRGHA